LPRALCLFAHYDADGQLGAHVRHLLNQIRACGFDIVMATSGHDSVPAPIAQFCAENGIAVLARPDGGLDFGAWQFLNAMGFTAGADTVLLANDSVFGPLFALPPVLARLRATGADVWGMADMDDVAWHLQSWFVGMTGAAFHSPAVQRVFAQPFATMSKPEVILHGEIGLGLAIRTEGFKTAVAWPQARTRLNRVVRRILPLNPMHVHWRSVVEQGRVPFIKIELLRDNPQGIGWIDKWRMVVGRSALFDPAWIADWLQTHPPRTPPVPPGVLPLLRALCSRDRGSLRTTLGLWGRPARRLWRDQARARSTRS